MKNKSLKEVMGQPLRVTVSESGCEITNGAGTANYDAWGNRTTVNGIPEYFPTSIKVTGAEAKNGFVVSGTVSINIVGSVEAILNNARPSDSAIPLIRAVIKNELRPGGLLYR
ncbi:MAG: hypothetical protein ACOH2G_05000 [Ewingella sp.]